MQGIFVNEQRPKSKKAIREAIAADPSSVYIEATALATVEYDGPATEMPEGTTIYFVGPDPYKTRNFYGQISRRGDKITVK